MATWLPPKKAAMYFKEKDPNTEIKESTIRTLIKDGFPHFTANTRCFIDVDKFDENMINYVNDKMNCQNEEPRSYYGVRKLKA